MKSGCKSEKHLTRVWAYRQVSYYNSRDYRVAVRFSRNVSSTEYRSNPTGRCGARENRESVLKERKRLQMFLGVICMWEKRRAHTNTHTHTNTEKKRERQRSMKKWKHEPSLFLWTLLHLVLLQSHTHTHLCNKLLVLSLLQIHTHARRCLHSNLKTFPSTTLCYLSTPTYTQWIHVTVPGVCVCVFSSASIHV